MLIDVSQERTASDRSVKGKPGPSTEDKNGARLGGAVYGTLAAAMRIQDLTVGMKVRHPQYGEGVVEKISNVDVSILFGNIFRTVDPELAEVVAAEATVKVEGLNMPLKQFVESTIEATLK